MLYCNKEHTSSHPPPHFLFAQDKEQGTPLHAAAYLGDVNTMELLIASGKNLTQSLWVNWTFITNRSCGKKKT